MPRKRHLPDGYKKDGRIDLRKLPKIVIRPLGREDAEGQAFQILHSDASGEPKLFAPPRIEIDGKYKGRRRMDSVIHEAMHLAFPFMPEATVLQGARYVAMVLWHMKYRPQGDE